MLVNAGFLGGIFSGAAVGAMVSPYPGVAVGALFGAFIGYFAGKVMHYEEERKSERNRYLDDVIGVTKGTLGTSRRNPPLPSELILQEAANRRWVAEWMTPQAPRVAEYR